MPPGEMLTEEISSGDSTLRVSRRLFSNEHFSFLAEGSPHGDFPPKNVSSTVLFDSEDSVKKNLQTVIRYKKCRTKDDRTLKGSMLKIQPKMKARLL